MVDRRILAAAITLLCILTPSLLAVEARVTDERSLAQAAVKTNPPKSTGTGTKANDREMELAATALVDTHLPELQAVLKHLRSEQPRQYELAIRDLAKSARRLDAVKNRDEQLYEIEVELLQAQSDCKLLTAKLKVRDNEADRKRLRAAAERLHQAEITRAKYDIRAIQDRLTKTQQMLEAAKTRLTTKQDEDQLEKSYLGFLRKAGRQPSRPASGN